MTKVLGLALSLLAAAAAGGAEPRPGKAIGEVVAVGDGRLTVRVEDGTTVGVVVETATRVLRTRPGATSLGRASSIALSDVAVGDRVLAVGAPGEDGALVARQVVVMSGRDIAARQDEERADWKRRGLTGVVKATNAETQELTLDVRGTARSVVVSTSEKKAAFRRYAADSVKFDDAKPSSLAEVRVGDQVRVLGDRSADGGRVLAEQVVSGSFRTVVGTVEAVDAGGRELRVVAGARSEKTAVSVAEGAIVRRFQPEMAKEVKAGADFADLLERMPPLPLADVAVGARVALSIARGAEADRVTAVVVVAGIEPLLAAPAPGRPGGAALMPGLPGGALDMGMGAP